MSRITNKERMWAIEGREWVLDSFKCCLEYVAEKLEDGAESVKILEYRAADCFDIDLDFLTDQMWDVLSDLLQEDEELSHDDGWPCLQPSHFKKDMERPVEWFSMRHALAQITRHHVDYCEAAWQPTGKEIVVTPENLEKLWDGCDE